MVVAGLAMVALPFVLLAGGLTLTSATDVVIFAIACMALNILVGHTGSCLSATAPGSASARMPRRLRSGTGSRVGAVADAVRAGFLVVAASHRLLVLRRRGVYFSLLTLAFTALVYAVAFRWTAFTGGENGLGGVTRATGSASTSRIAGCITRSSRSSDLRWSVACTLPPLADRPRAGGDTRERAARAVHRLLDAALQADRVCAFRGIDRIRRVLFAFHHRFASADPPRCRSPASCWRW
jgi:hypothetical protein